MTDSSSDDDFYDNFEKIKAKAAQEMRRIEERNNQNYQQKSTRKDEKHLSEKNNYMDLGKESFSNIDEKLMISNDRSSNSSSIFITEKNNVLTRRNPTLTIDLTNENENSFPLVCSSSNSTYSVQTCNIYIHSNGNTRIFVHDLDDKIILLINAYAERTGSNPERIILITKQLKRCNPDDTPRSLGFTNNSTIELDAFENIEEIEKKTIRIKYQMKGRKAIIQKVLQELNFEQLKQIFCNEHKLNPLKVCFVFDSERLNDDDTPSSIGLEDMDCVDVYLKE